MKSSIDRNSYYRYKITQTDDILDSTYQRRLLKKQQSRALQFIFDASLLPLDQLNTIVPFLLSHKETPVFFRYSEKIDYTLFSELEIFLQIESLDEYLGFLSLNLSPNQKLTLIFAPKTKKESLQIIEMVKKDKSNHPLEWFFTSYNPKIKNSLTVSEIYHLIKENQLVLTQLPFTNCAIPHHHELESLETPDWIFKTNNRNIQISVIIPTYNNCLFLSNVVRHLLSQTTSGEKYELIIVDDGSTDHTKETLHSLVYSRRHEINIQYIYWSKANPVRGDQSFFRAGLARNLGVQYAVGEKLMFLDSDMLVPEDFIETCIKELNHFDLIQFSRLHIKQVNSQKNPSFAQIDIKSQTYIEEEHYWNQLFQTPDWNQMEYFWKYTCTYALGISKADFYGCGRFKRHFVSYGFEDTDIGFRMAKKKKKFKLIQKPLLHLTNYSTMQYQNSKFIRDQLLRKTSKLLYLDHLDPEIYEAFHFYYNFEKSLYALIRDFF